MKILVKTADFMIHGEIELPDDLLLFLDDVASMAKDFNVYLGGGYLRDLFCGLTPKDVDIFFVPKDHNYLRFVYVPQHCYVNYRRDSGSMSEDLQARGVFEVTGLMVKDLSTKDVQYIVYRDDDLGVIEDVAEDMDMNICQIMYDVKSGDCFATDAFIEGHRNQTIECLSDYDEVRMWHRYERMAAKFPDYTLVGQPEIDDEDKSTERARVEAGSFLPLDG